MVEDYYSTYLTGLAASHAIPTAWGARFVKGTNLFLYTAPDNILNSLTIVPYQGSKPDTIKPDVYYPNIQIWIKNKTPHIAVDTGIELIKAIHRENTIINGVIFSLDSSPRIIGLDDVGTYHVTVNFQNKFVLPL